MTGSGNSDGLHNIPEGQSRTLRLLVQPPVYLREGTIYTLTFLSEDKYFSFETLLKYIPPRTLYFMSSFSGDEHKSHIKSCPTVTDSVAPGMWTLIYWKSSCHKL